MAAAYLTLSEALGIRAASVVALIGGGGKTSTLVRLAQETAQDGHRVLATTTARMKLDELNDMRDVLLWDDRDVTGETWRSYRDEATTGSSTGWIDAFLEGQRPPSRIPVSFLGRSVMRDKVVGLPSEYLGQLLSRLNWDVVVVEADGSRGRSIKGHRLGEPVLPLCATHCVIVVGADGFELPLNEESCHRPEVIQDLVGVAWGERLDPRAIATLITHPKGVLTKIPGDMEVVVYVNKAPIGEQAQAARFAQEILRRAGRRIQRVAVGDNLQGGLVETFLAEGD
ncbi:MAG: selenium cofactor biosynthesis protein YqeC [bacterium]